jgi:hypothetical protein
MSRTMVVSIDFVSIVDDDVCLAENADGSSRSIDHWRRAKSLVGQKGNRIFQGRGFSDRNWVFGHQVRGDFGTENQPIRHLG